MLETKMAALWSRGDNRMAIMRQTTRIFFTVPTVSLCTQRKASVKNILAVWAYQKQSKHCTGME